MQSEDRFGKYELLERLGQGGMAEVFLAVAPGLAGFSKKLVLKRVLPSLEADPNQVEMFLDEARLAARLEHPNICQVFDLGEHEGTYFIVMEHVPGVAFNKVIEFFRKQGKLVPYEVGLRAVAQLLEALEYAHSLKDERGRPLNLVHRDVTPSNIMVTPQGSVKLLDFGIARASTRRHQTQVGMTKGKLGYMSPEQCRADPLDNRSDLFAVGAILYVLSTGRTPYITRNMSTETFEDMVYARFPRPSDVQPAIPAALERVILNAMAADPKDRYARAFDMLRDVEGVAQELGVSLGPNQLSEVVQAIAGPPAPLPPVDEAQTRARPSTGSRERLVRPVTPPPPPADVTGALPAASVETRSFPGGGNDEGVETKDLRAGPRGAPTERLPPVVPPLEAAASPVKLPLPDIDTIPSNKELSATARTLEPVRSAPRTSMVIALVLAVVALGVVAAAALSLVSRQAERPLPIDEAEVIEPPPEALGVAPPPEAPAVEAAVVTGPVASSADAGEAPTVLAPPGPSRGPPRVRPPTAPAPAPRMASPVVLPPGTRTGTLMVTSTPRAQVRVDKRLLGETPLEVTLPEGTQRIELVYPGQPPRRILVTIVAGQRTPLTDTL
ncbi:MAG: serine/threonine-protein kinase [Myxococcaceae bacterium]|nr:serine/threonine-protein kinase [Myxococcaceae bacterium]